MLAHQPPQIARANGIDICYEIFGDAGRRTAVADHGARRPDDPLGRRFLPLSSPRAAFASSASTTATSASPLHLSGGKRLTPFELPKLRFLKIPVAATYKLIDMAKDTVGLMDVLGIKSAHLVGASMGGMIAQEVALSFPQRVRSLTSIMSTTGQSESSAADARGRRRADGAAAEPPRRNISSGSPRPGRCCASARFPEDEALDPDRAARNFERGLNPAGVGRQLRAVLASGSRKERLRPGRRRRRW